MDTITLSPMKRASQAFAGIALATILAGAAIHETPASGIRKNTGESAVSRSSIVSGEDTGWQAEAVREMESEEPLPDIRANAGVAKLMKGETLYTFRAGGRWPMASLTKLMTGIIALENLPAEENRNDLVKRMMVFSDNAAADELGNALGMDEWVRLMNAKATRLKMNDSGFTDASGLSYLNQSTAYDMEKLVSYIMEEHPEMLAWSKIPSLTVDGAVRANINEFASRPDFIGGKTGFTDEASGNLVSVFATDRGPLMLVVLGAGGREERFRETEKLFLWLQRHFKLYGY